MEMLSAYAIIILAAGNSSRLGEPKQLLKYQNKTLIRHITEAAAETVGSNVIVVTGSNAELIQNEIDGLSFQLAHNADWQEGMASSIVTGVSKLITLNPQCQGAVIAVSDQPFVTSSLFRDLIQSNIQNGSGIVASSYDQTVGTPVFFSSSYFPQLLQLTGVEGAKKLIKRFESDVTTISFPLGSIDIDTQEDYGNLLSLS
ncbi:nucleotidyltransferase family protein [Dyadobacter pollutisoli]|uniref:Nucleotidyltransferase family protein n=1 Tax=Dyadobacter pollutisoli TaxID=2910158 RepID=A0A9E8N9B6_9BACT|nr:nucleotidyltransferase family protein [Dyadobacter pollutisoli]WAC12364.1 nucleotidyltransferase family protein [Dyadobacter pollutisoli]